MANSTSDYTAPTIPGPDTNTRAPSFQIPAGACDCHAHVFGPQGRYSYHPQRQYTPPDASLTDYLRVLETLGIDRAVLVQPSVYLTDNTALLDALSGSTIPLRGVVVIDPSISDAELRRMHELGVRGARLNLRYENKSLREAAPALARRVALLGWHVQLWINPEEFADAEPILQALPVDIVVDHIGQIPVEEGLGGRAFGSLLRLVRNNRCWVKLSAPMRMSAREYPYADVVPFIRALVETNPGRMVWASDWPHTTLSKRMPNDGDLLDLLRDWIPSETVRQQVLVDNPSLLYGF